MTDITDQQAEVPEAVSSVEISPGQFAWLGGQLEAWQRDGLITADTAQEIRGRYTPTRRAPVAALILSLGGIFVAIGLIWLVAANLDQLSPLLRFTGITVLWLGLVVVAEVLAGRRLGTSAKTARPASTARPARASQAVVGTARLLAVAAYGAVIFQAAQSLHVEAGATSLVGFWALGSLLYAYAVRGSAPLVLGVAAGSWWFLMALDGAGGYRNKVVVVLLAVPIVASIGVLHRIAPQRFRAAAWSAQSRHRLRRFGDVWTVDGAALGLGALFLALLPNHGPGAVAPPIPVVAVLLVLAAAAIWLGGRTDRLEVLGAMALTLVGLIFLYWAPGALAGGRASGAALAWTVLGMVVYLVAAVWFAVLGVLRDLTWLTSVAGVALVVFVLAQSGVLFVEILPASVVFLLIGVLLLGLGLLVERGRRHLVTLVRENVDDPTWESAPPPGGLPPEEESQGPTRTWRSRTLWVGAATAISLALVPFAVAGQLSARWTGTEYRMRVAPLDPVDPFRGAYVSLRFPDLSDSLEQATYLAVRPEASGKKWVYIPLTAQGEHWVGGRPQLERGTGPVLRCPVDSGPWDSCGLGSYFLPQSDAAAVERAVGAGTAIATIKVDDAGRSLLIGLDAGGAQPLPPDPASPSPSS